MTGQTLGAAGNTALIRLRRTTTFSSINNRETACQFNTVDEDTTGSVNLATTANLTGTVQKTSGTASLAGTGTLFDTELQVGSLITVSGESRTVIDLVSATSLTVDSNWGASAGPGITATWTINDRIVIPTKGIWLPSVKAIWPNNTTGYREAVIRAITAAAYVMVNDQNPPTAVFTMANVGRPFRAAVGDHVAPRVWQNSTTTLTMVAGFEFHLLRVGD